MVRESRSQGARHRHCTASREGIEVAVLRELTEAYQLLQEPAVLAGISRTCQPVDEDGEQHPPESKKVQMQAEDLIDEVTTALTDLFDLTATKDWANCDARADVVVDGGHRCCGAERPR